MRKRPMAVHAGSLTAFVLCALVLLPAASGAATYTWNVALGFWTDPVSWAPARNVPAATDVLVFDGSITPTADVLDLATDTIAQLRLTNGAQVSMTNSLVPPAIVTIAGDTGPDFLIEPASELLFLAADATMSITMGAGTTARIDGRLISEGPSEINSPAAGSVEFTAGSLCHLRPGHATSFFLGVNGTFIFRSGSVFRAGVAFANPFGTPGQNRSVFEHGSLFRNEAGLGGGGFYVNRTFGDYEWDSPLNLAFNNSGTCTMDNVRILQGGMHLGSAYVWRVLGNFEVSPGATGGVFGGVTNRLVFAGTAPQTISSPDDPFTTGLGLQVAATASVEITNPAGVDAAHDLHWRGSVGLTSGRLRTGSNTLHLASTGSVSAVTHWIEGRLALEVPAGGATSRTFPVGDAARRAPVTLSFPSVATAGEIAVQTTPGDHPSLGSSGLNGARSLNRRWAVSNAGAVFGSCDAVFGFDTADLDPGTSTAALRVGKYDAPTWTLPTVGAQLATSTQALGITSFSDFVLAEALPADEIAAVPGPGTCISTATPCIAVPVVWDRTATTPARAFSVTLQLSPNLTLCGAQFASGGYLLPGSGGALFQVTPLGGNQYTVDEVTLGIPCGATGDGTLFTMYVTSGDPGGVGSITVLSTTTRDCSNVPIPSNPGAVANIPIDNQAPAAVALSAAQKKTGNVQPPNGTTDVLVSWGGQELGSTVAVYRKGFGGYPQYDENGGSIPTTPATPAAAVLAGWTLTGVTTSGGADRTGARDFYYYVAFATDGCGNVSTVSNQTGGTLNYHLGDVHDGLANCAGNDLVNTQDVSFLGAHYGTTTAINGPVECLDVGPTTDFTVDARPTTDNRVNFEDLIVLAINHGLVSAPQARALPEVASANALRLSVPRLPAVGETFAVGLELEGAGTIQGLTSELGYDGSVVEFLGVTPGELLGAQAAPGVALSSGPGGIDVALLGAGAGLRGRGTVARAQFRVRRAGEAAIVLRSLDARDASNQPVALNGQASPVTAAAPARTSLAAARPTPFRESTTLEYAIAQEGPVELAIYGVDGRKVATLERGERSAGVYRVAWDGRDSRGASAPAGMYYARLITPEGRFTRTLVRVR